MEKKIRTEVKTIDLSKLPVTLLDDEEAEIDLAKELAQVIFANTQSIEEHSFSIDLYKNPIVDLTDKNRDTIERYIDMYFKAYVKIAIKKLL